MLRYFYIIVCIQVCFCSVYVDNNDYETLERRVRCKTTKSDKKQTRSPRKSRLVQFDVQDFMRTPDADADSKMLYGYRSKRLQNRLVSEFDDNVAEAENAVGTLDGSGTNIELNREGENHKASKKYQGLRHFNFHPHGFKDKVEEKLTHDHKKATTGYKQDNLVEDGIINYPEKRCSFKNMKIPFFSRNKATAKSKRHKKRKIFCFGCTKKTTTVSPVMTATIEATELKTNDLTKNSLNIPNAYDKSNGKYKLSKVYKRSYDNLCPKCIKELFLTMKRKTTTKKGIDSVSSKEDQKTTGKPKTTKQKADLSDSFQEGNLDTGNERMKRHENDEQERNRRLKELDEVERKVENVRVYFQKYEKNSQQ